MSDTYEHFDNKSPFILSETDWRVPKSKKKPDTLSCRYDEIWSGMRMEALGGRPCFYFNVLNETKQHTYQTELFEGVRGEPCAVCNCPAAVVCKHILLCLRRVLDDHDPDFGSAFRDCDFFRGFEFFS